MDIPSNPLFWVGLGICLIGYVGTLIYLHTRGRESDEGFHSGRVPGYSYTAGHNVGLDASVVQLEAGDWLPTRLETLHSQERSRLILSLAFDADIDGDAPLQEFLSDLAREVQARSDADVVYVQAEHEYGVVGRWHYLFAPDGHGWWGRERVREAYRSPLTRPFIELS